jgi:hypothetical protein
LPPAWHHFNHCMHSRVSDALPAHASVHSAKAISQDAMVLLLHS